MRRDALTVALFPFAFMCTMIIVTQFTNEA